MIPKILTIASAAILSSGLAMASPILMQPGQPSLTPEASGIIHGSGVMEKSVNVRDRNEWVAVTGIELAEHRDDPIRIDLQLRSICAVEGTRCPQNLQWRRFYLRQGQTGNAPSFRKISIGAGRYVTGLQVCTNGQQGARAKIKGVRIWGGEVRSDGSVRTFGNPVQIRRTNCQTWQQRVNCPANRVMTGMRVYYAGGTGANAFRPLCSTVGKAG